MSTNKFLETHKEITLVFRRPTATDGRGNRLLSKITGGMFHVDLVLERLPSDECLVFSIRRGGYAGLTLKTFEKNPAHEYVKLVVHKGEHDRVCEFCELMARKKFSYGHIALAWMCFPFRLQCLDSQSSSRWGTFCSKIVTEALQYGGLQETQGICPSFTSPEQLFRRVERSPRRLGPRPPVLDTRTVTFAGIRSPEADRNPSPEPTKPAKSTKPTYLQRPKNPFCKNPPIAHRVRTLYYGPLGAWANL